MQQPRCLYKSQFERTWYRMNMKYWLYRSYNIGKSDGTLENFEEFYKEFQKVESK